MPVTQTIVYALETLTIPTSCLCLLQDDFIQPDWFSYGIFYRVYCNYVKRRDVDVLFNEL